MANGIVITDLWKKEQKPGKRWLVRVWDPYAHKYKSKRFEKRKDGERWATGQSAQQQKLIDPELGSITLEEVLPTYIAALKRLNRSPDYIENTNVVLQDAIDKGVGDLSKRALLIQTEKWLDLARSLHPRREGKPLSASTLNGYRRTIRALVHWCQRRQLVEHDHLMGLTAATVDAPLKEVLTLEEVRRVLEHATKPEVWVKYGRLVTIMMYTGMRLEEACHLKWEAIDFSAKMVYVRLGDYRLKRRRERLIPLQPELAKLLRREDINKNPWPGTTLPAIRDLRRDQHRRRFKKLLKEAGINRDGITPHSCRHTWISLMLATGENAPLVQIYAGHQDLKTTAGYSQSQARYRNQVEGWPRGVLRLNLINSGQLDQSKIARSR